MVEYDGKRLDKRTPGPPLLKLFDNAAKEAGRTFEEAGAIEPVFSEAGSSRELLSTELSLSLPGGPAAQSEVSTALSLRPPSGDAPPARQIEPSAVQSSGPVMQDAVGVPSMNSPSTRLSIGSTARGARTDLPADIGSSRLMNTPSPLAPGADVLRQTTLPVTSPSSYPSPLHPDLVSAHAPAPRTLRPPVGDSALDSTSATGSSHFKLPGAAQAAQETALVSSSAPATKRPRSAGSRQARSEFETLIQPPKLSIAAPDVTSSVAASTPSGSAHSDMQGRMQRKRKARAEPDVDSAPGRDGLETMSRITPSRPAAASTSLDNAESLRTARNKRNLQERARYQQLKLDAAAGDEAAADKYARKLEHGRSSRPTTRDDKDQRNARARLKYSKETTENKNRKNAEQRGKREKLKQDLKSNDPVIKEWARGMDSKLKQKKALYNQRQKLRLSKKSQPEAASGS